MSLKANFFLICNTIFSSFFFFCHTTQNWGSWFPEFHSGSTSLIHWTAGEVPLEHILWSRVVLGICLLSQVTPSPSPLDHLRVGSLLTLIVAVSTIPRTMSAMQKLISRYLFSEWMDTVNRTLPGFVFFLFSQPFLFSGSFSFPSIPPSIWVALRN